MDGVKFPRALNGFAKGQKHMHHIFASTIKGLAKTWHHALSGWSLFFRCADNDLAPTWCKSFYLADTPKLPGQPNLLRSPTPNALTNTRRRTQNSTENDAKITRQSSSRRSKIRVGRCKKGPEFAATLRAAISQKTTMPCLCEHAKIGRCGPQAKGRSLREQFVSRARFQTCNPSKKAMGEPSIEDGR